MFNPLHRAAVCGGPRGEAPGLSRKPSGEWTSLRPLALVSPYAPARTQGVANTPAAVARAAALPCASSGFRAPLHCTSSLGPLAHADDLLSAHPDPGRVLPRALCSCAPPLLGVATSGDAPCGQARREGAAWQSVRDSADHLRSRFHAQQWQGERRCLSSDLSAAGGKGLVPKHRRRRSHGHRGDRRSYAALATRTTRCCRGERRRGERRKG